jgi:hypothetical protein
MWTKIERRNMNGKKSQIIGQVFIYMMAAIIIGGIVLVGYKAITKILVTGCEAEKANFRADMENMIEKYTSYGSINKKAIKAPCEYDTICFIDYRHIGTDPDFVCDNNRLIYDSVKNNASQNIFVVSNKRTIPIGYTELITLNSSDELGCLCINQRSKNFYITFNGKGSSTEISSG